MRFCQELIKIVIEGAPKDSKGKPDLSKLMPGTPRGNVICKIIDLEITEEIRISMEEEVKGLFDEGFTELYPLNPRYGLNAVIHFSESNCVSQIQNRIEWKFEERMKK